MKKALLFSVTFLFCAGGALANDCEDQLASVGTFFDGGFQKTGTETEDYLRLVEYLYIRKNALSAEDLRTLARLGADGNPVELAAEKLSPSDRFAFGLTFNKFVSKLTDVDWEAVKVRLDSFQEGATKKEADRSDARRATNVGFRGIEKENYPLKKGTIGKLAFDLPDGTKMALTSKDTKTGFEFFVRDLTNQKDVSLGMGNYEPVVFKSKTGKVWVAFYPDNVGPADLRVFEIDSSHKVTQITESLRAFTRKYKDYQLDAPYLFENKKGEPIVLVTIQGLSKDYSESEMLGTYTKGYLEINLKTQETKPYFLKSRKDGFLVTASGDILSMSLDGTKATLTNVRTGKAYYKNVRLPAKARRYHVRFTLEGDSLETAVAIPYEVGQATNGYFFKSRQSLNFDNTNPYVISIVPNGNGYALLRGASSEPNNIEIVSKSGTKISHVFRVPNNGLSMNSEIIKHPTLGWVFVGIQTDSSDNVVSALIIPLSNPFLHTLPLKSHKLKKYLGTQILADGSLQATFAGPGSVKTIQLFGQMDEGGPN